MHFLAKPFPRFFVYSLLHIIWIYLLRRICLNFSLSRFCRLDFFASFMATFNLIGLAKTSHKILFSNRVIYILLKTCSQLFQLLKPSIICIQPRVYPVTQTVFHFLWMCIFEDVCLSFKRMRSWLIVAQTHFFDCFYCTFTHNLYQPKIVHILEWTNFESDRLIRMFLFRSVV